jgi:outer membrane protein assembly factor BamB
VVWTAAAVALVACGGHATGAAGTAVPAPSAGAVGVAGADWPTFDFNPQRSGVGPKDTGITAANLHTLKRLTVRLPGTVDSSPIELHAVTVGGRVRDVIFVTTSYGRTLALDAATGARLWQFVPGDIGHLQGSPQITAATPVADPDRRYIYAASPDGYIHKLAVADGHQLWRTKITYDPTHEKIPASLNISGGSVLVTTGGYDGDIPPYQGHVVLIDRATGRLAHVWNSLCSNRHRLIDPPGSCPASDSAIWGRSGGVVEPDGDILVATGNAPFNGRSDWGDSVLELSPTLRLLHNWTPRDQARLNSDDLDLGSTAPALLPVVDGLRLAVMGGKAGVLSLLNLARLDGTTHRAGPRTGGELQDIADPGSTDLFTEPAVWTGAGRINVFVADNSGTADYVLDSRHRLRVAWTDSTPGTSPVVAGGLLYVYDQADGALVVRSPRTGRQLASLPAAAGHWNSPIVVGGRIILPEGNDNDHATTGTLDIYHLPGV